MNILELVKNCAWRSMSEQQGLDWVNDAMSTQHRLIPSVIFSQRTLTSHRKHLLSRLLHLTRCAEARVVKATDSFTCDMWWPPIEWS